MNATFTPYCGNPPVPGTLSWTLDPVLISVFLGIGLAYVVRARAVRSDSNLQHVVFAAASRAWTCSAACRRSWLRAGARAEPRLGDHGGDCLIYCRHLGLAHAGPV